MTDISPAIEESSQVGETGKPNASTRSLRFALLFAAACFALAFTATRIQNTRKPVLELSSLFDSGAYLMSVKEVIAIAGLVKGGMALDAAARAIGPMFLFNGPVLPIMGAAFYSAFNMYPDCTDMRAALLLQDCIHSLAAALLALAGWRFTGGRVVGLFAGVVFALYPGAITGTGRFLTETITSLFLSMSVLACTYIPKERKNSKLYLSSAASLLFALSISLLMLTKAALAPGALLAVLAVVLVLVLSNVERRSLVIALVSTVLGFSLVIAPWLMFTKVATGEYQLLVKRMPTFNMAAGLSPETDGWSALPDTGLINLFSESDGPAAVASALYRLNPGDFYGRMARKPLRLFQFPWNDYKLDIVGLPLAAQIIAHQIIVLFGFFGILSFMALPMSLRTSVNEKEKPKNEPSADLSTAKQPHPELISGSTIGSDGKRIVHLRCADPSSMTTVLTGVFCLVVIAGHVAYLPFVADSRYGFTTIPFLILFACWCVSGWLNARFTKASIIKLFISMSFITLAFSLKNDVWRSLFATSTPEIFATSLCMGALLLFIGCLMAVRTLLGAGRANAPAKVLIFLVSYLALTLSLAASLAGKDMAFDWEGKLSDKEEFLRTVKLDHVASPPTDAMVLVNIRGDWRTARLKVNGQEINQPPVSILQLTGLSMLCGDYRTFGSILHSDTGGLEQWRAFIVPPNILNLSGDNTISICGSKNKHSVASLTGSTTSGATPKSSDSGIISGPSLKVFSPTKLLNSPFCLDPRLREEFPRSVSKGICRRKTSAGTVFEDLSDSPGNQYGQYHMFLLVGDSKATEVTSTRHAANSHPIYINVRPAPAAAKSKTPKHNRLTYDGAAIIEKSALVQPHVRLTLTGEAESVGALSVKFCLHDWRLLQSPIELASDPTLIEGTGKRKFRLVAIAQSNNIDPNSAFVMIKISSDLVPLSISNLRLEVAPLTAPALTISGKRWF